MVDGRVTLLAALSAAGVGLVALVAVRVRRWWRESDTAEAVRVVARGAAAAAHYAAAAAAALVILAAARPHSRRTATLRLTARRRWRLAAPAAAATLAARAAAGRSVGTVLRVRATPSGERLVVRLPRGVAAATLNAEALAAAFDAPSVVVDAGRTARVAHLRVRRRDTLAEPRTRPALPAVWEPRVAIGVEEDGDEVVLDMGAAHTLLGGTTRAGKSNTLHGLIAHFAANPDCALYVWDGKGGAELGAWRAHCARFHDGEGVGTDAALAVTAMIERRFGRLLEAGLTSAAGRHDLFPPVLVVMDEVGAYAGQGRAAQRLLGALRDAMMRGLAVNVSVVLASQKPTADSVPSALSALAENRVAFKCGSYEMAVAIVGHDAAEFAYRDLPSPESSPEGRRRTAGRFVVSERGRVAFGRAYLADPDALVASVPARSARCVAEHPPEGGEARPRAGAGGDARESEAGSVRVGPVDVTRPASGGGAARRPVALLGAAPRSAAAESGAAASAGSSRRRAGETRQQARERRRREWAERQR